MNSEMRSVLRESDDMVQIVRFCLTKRYVVIIVVIYVKYSLGALSKYVVGIELDCRVTLGTVTLVRVKSSRVIAIWIGDRYMKQMKLFMSMTENNFID